MHAKSLLAIGFFFASCSVETTVDASAPAAEQRSALEGAFELASSEYQVPVEVLKSIAWVETRVGEPRGPSLRQAYGVMQLSAREDWNMLSRAARLTGVSEGRLKIDTVANIRGAAAVLRDLADASFRQYPDLQASEVGDWFHAVSLYPGIDSASLAQDYAADVFSSVAQGVKARREDGVVVSEPRVALWQRHAGIAALKSELKEYPQAFQWRASPNFSVGRNSYDYVVIHTTQGSYNGTLSWFQNRSSSVSSHYVVRSSDGQVTQMVEHQDTAWHAGCYNSKSIGIEHEGFVEDPARWYTPAMYEESAKLTRWIADRHNIPKDRSHIVGHVEIDPACNKNKHRDPGTGWNWTHYMSLVNGTGVVSGTGKVMGIVYENGNVNARVSNATVTINGNSKVTGTDGLYEFVLAPGTYSITVTKSNYQPTTTSAVVTSQQTVWASVDLQPVGKGKLVGMVYEYNASRTPSQSKPIVGAKVDVGGKQVVTNTQGYYEVELPIGTYTATAGQTNYFPSSVTRTVTVGGVVWGSIGLSLMSVGTNVQPISLVISSPTAGSEFDIADNILSGAVDNAPADIQNVELTLNEAPKGLVSVKNGAFQSPLKLLPGKNVISISAVSPSGDKVSASTQVMFHSGVTGKVHILGQPDAAIRDADVQLLNVASGEVVAQGRTTEDGRVDLNVVAVPNDFRVVVKKDGYLTASETISVPDDRRLTVELPLTPGKDFVAENLSIEWAEPSAQARVSSEKIQVFGTVVGMQVVAVQVNGVAAELIGAGGFSATIPLALGENTLEAVARGSSDERIVSKLVVYRDEVKELPPVTGKGCNSASGLPWVALASLLWGARKIRRANIANASSRWGG